MQLGAIQNLLRPWDEVRVLNRTAEVEGTTVVAAALVRWERRAALWLLQYDPTFRDRLEEAELRDLNDPPAVQNTNGGNLFSQGEVDARLPAGALRAVCLGEREYPAACCESGRIQSGDWEAMLCLTLLLQAGWEPGELAEVDSDDLFFSIVELRGDFDALPPADGPVTLVPSERTASRLAAVRATVPVGENQDIPMDIPDGPRVYLKALDWADPWAHLERTFSDPKVLERFTPEELQEQRRQSEENMEKFCPRGKALPAVTYEGPEDVSLQFYLQNWLDAKPDRRDGAFGMILGRQGAAETGPHGLPLKTTALSDLPMEPAGVMELTIGAVRWHKRQKREPITL